MAGVRLFVAHREGERTQIDEVVGGDQARTILSEGGRSNSRQKRPNHKRDPNRVESLHGSFLTQRVDPFLKHMF